MIFKFVCICWFWSKKIETQVKTHGNSFIELLSSRLHVRRELQLWSGIRSYTVPTLAFLPSSVTPFQTPNPLCIVTSSFWNSHPNLKWLGIIVSSLLAVFILNDFNILFRTQYYFNLAGISWVCPARREPLSLARASVPSVCAPVRAKGRVNR